MKTPATYLISVASYVLTCFAMLLVLKATHIGMLGYGE